MEASKNIEINLINITDKAKSQLRSILENQEAPAKAGVRVGVVGGGCSGLSYKIDFDNFKENDHTLSFDSLNVYIDLKSAIYLKGITLDFNDGLNGKGFVFVNPNATNTCGCGESFSV